MLEAEFTHAGDSCTFEVRTLALHARQSFVLARTGWSHTPAPNHCCLPAGPMKAFAVELKVNSARVRSRSCPL
jgi:hypothetical protein